MMNSGSLFTSGILAHSILTAIGATYFFWTLSTFIIIDQPYSLASAIGLSAISITSLFAVFSIKFRKIVSRNNYFFNLFFILILSP